MRVIIVDDHTVVRKSGIDATRAICSEHPGVRVIGLSMYKHSEEAQPMLDAGAIAYICKTAAPEVLLAAIRRCGIA